MFFSMMLPKDSLPPNVMKVLDWVFNFHVVMFFIACGFFLYHSFFTSAKQRLAE